MKTSYKLVIAAFFCILAAIGIDLFLLPHNTDQSATASKEENAFVGDAACRSCHAIAYKHWQSSDHFMAMQPATDSTVKGNFNNTVLTADGVTSRFFKKGDRFFIHTQGGDGKYHDFEIKYTFGFYPLQQYLVEFPGGRMQVTRASWDARQNKWFHQYKGQQIPAGDWLHWTGNAQNWNTTCADCHSTNVKKNYDIESDTYKTTYSAINVSCEACHGAGKNHIDYINNDYKAGNKIKGSALEMPGNTSQLTQINTCAPCHARRTVISNTPLASTGLLDNYIPDIPSTENFYADGQIKDEDFIYTSFLQSKMFQAGVKCSNCHEPHSQKVLFIDNKLCLQCHQQKYNDLSHTFHAASTAGAKCVNCHMPGKYYMGNDYRHDHSFRVPRPDLSVKFGTPNSCNNCHTDKSSQWAAGTVEKWYGKTRRYHFSEDLIPGSNPGPDAEPHLLKLLDSKTIPAIIKATAASYLANTPSEKSLNALLACIKSSDAQVRYRALRSLASYEPPNWINAAAPLLNDPVRAVRIAAADLFLTVPPDQLPPGYDAALKTAKNDLSVFLRNQADFAAGNVMLGDYYMRLQDNTNAEKFYLRGLKKDSLMNLARLNLAVVYNLQGKNALALSTLKTAAKITPKNSQIYFNMALLYNEMGDRPNALACFEKAMLTGSDNPRLYYNYGLLLLQTDIIKAETILQKGAHIWPKDNSLHYALAYLYLKQNKLLQALEHASVLKNTDPGNPEYSSIFNALRMQ
ncbi:tetratricopeptide repeat protein [Pedobacter sp. BS3]|uniref:tetratricopeptide repeat protein n=1 Tax=Pedobacter sp. BS3 TaxID=2567937 RepID=UPI0011EF424C|nr:multiheme c-type cytochrome [Pedobacter sp. BS3]TZF81170.1 tetratricopeptide repeat protein [Pedobacter sp. BS3]